MEILLDWNSPLVVGKQLPASQTEVDLLRGNGVYLWYRQYRNADLVAYVGMTKRGIALRFKEHIGKFFSLQCNARRPDGTIFADDTPLRYFQTLMNLDGCIEIAKSEVALTRFHYAFMADTDIGNTEAYLIVGLTDRARSTIGQSRPIIFGQNQPSFDRSTRLRHSFCAAQRGGSSAWNSCVSSR